MACMKASARLHTCLWVPTELLSRPRFFISCLPERMRESTSYAFVLTYFIVSCPVLSCRGRWVEDGTFQIIFQSKNSSNRVRVRTHHLLCSLMPRPHLHCGGGSGGGPMRVVVSCSVPLSSNSVGGLDGLILRDVVRQEEVVPHTSIKIVSQLF